MEVDSLRGKTFWHAAQRYTSNLPELESFSVSGTAIHIRDLNPVWTGEGGGGKMLPMVFAKYLKIDLADLHET